MELFYGTRYTNLLKYARPESITGRHLLKIKVCAMIISMTRLQKILFGAILAGVILLVTSGSWVPRIGIIYTVYLMRNDTWLAILPMPKNILKADAITSTALSHDGLKFQVPWRSMGPRNNQETFAAASSDGNKSIFISQEINIKNNLIKKTPDDAAMLKIFFGEEVLASQYALYKTILYASPKNISAFSRLSTSLPQIILVTLKRALVMNAGEGISEFETAEIRGFQFGNQNSKSVSIVFFDEKDNRYLMGARGATEEEIDYILSSMKAADEK